MAAILFLANQPDKKPSDNTSQSPANVSCEGLEIKNSCLALERVETNQARVKGLSDREGLPDNTGMLFVFEAPAEQCFWMKDMRFDIDIIWTNQAKQIIKIEKAVSPDSYPKSFCAEDTKYVLEFDGGFAEEYGLKTGTRLKF
ncbi:DUF192 domain-containing protein [Candidatus Parcubacteria bacterium]|nr:DUF192 domain-containing protein [Candidatus Parcubacteria bacterium]